MSAETGIVDLLAPRIHHRADLDLHVGALPCHGFQGGTGCAQLILRPGKAFGRRHADTDARKGPGAGRHGDHVHVFQLQPGIFQQIGHHGHEGGGMGQPAVLKGLGQQSFILRHRHRSGDRRGLQGKDLQIATPSMVMTRLFSSAPRLMEMRMASSSMASSTFSLHSTAQTPPRAR